MALVDSEYAPELAVISAWISALMPWSVTFLDPANVSVKVVLIRYAYFQLQFLLNFSFPAKTFYWIHEAIDFVQPNVRPALWVGAAGSVFLTGALVLSIAYYAAEERVEELPVDPVRAMGVFLGGATLLYLGATGILWQEKAGLTVPIAPLFMAVFSGTLLTIDRP